MERPDVMPAVSPREFPVDQTMWAPCDWRSSAGAVNAGLAEVCVAEGRDESGLMGAMVLLEQSAMFRLAVADFEQGMGKAETAEMRSFELKLLCARVLLAGAFAGRKAVR